MFRAPEGIIKAAKEEKPSVALSSCDTYRPTHWPAWKDMTMGVMVPFVYCLDEYFLQYFAYFIYFVLFNIFENFIHEYSIYMVFIPPSSSSILPVYPSTSYQIYDFFCNYYWYLHIQTDR